MLKPQDIVLLIKLLANPKHLSWSQHQLATHLCLSSSAINASLIRLQESGLLLSGVNNKRYQLVLPACEELLIHGVKYFFPAILSQPTSGIPTSYAAPVFKGKVTQGEEIIPVWPSAKGTVRGMGLEPLYHCIPDSLLNYPDQQFYDLLALLDLLRQGRAREKNMAKQLLEDLLANGADNGYD